MSWVDWLIEFFLLIEEGWYVATLGFQLPDLLTVSLIFWYLNKIGHFSCRENAAGQRRILKKSVEIQFKVTPGMHVSGEFLFISFCLKNKELFVCSLIAWKTYLRWTFASVAGYNRLDKSRHNDDCQDSLRCMWSLLLVNTSPSEYLFVAIFLLASTHVIICVCASPVEEHYDECTVASLTRHEKWGPTLLTGTHELILSEDTQFISWHLR